MLARSPESERSLGFDGETVTPNVPGPFGWHRDRLEHAKAAEFVAESLEPREPIRRNVVCEENHVEGGHELALFCWPVS